MCDKVARKGFVNIKITAMTFGDGQVSCETRWVTESVIRNETDRGVPETL
jgi:hypothetical protein